MCNIMVWHTSLVMNQRRDIDMSIVGQDPSSNANNIWIVLSSFYNKTLHNYIHTLEDIKSTHMHT